MHVDDCSDCVARLDRRTPIEGVLDAKATPSWMSHEAANPKPPEIAGYEGLLEVGRGGCGVVYQACELATGRDVAIKVIRSGLLATPAEHARFRAEARAAATLRHPNVVTVYAVGGPGQVPHYVMEYLPGGSLASRLRGTPCDPHAAAALIQAVADAVHHAHERGVVHRDLKPGNILLDDAPNSGPFGSPKVADFGMAKVADAGLFLTPTQAAVGTPSYMAPEQAFGRSPEVGPPSDVYGLGAILYELLTGRPPFRGETPYETLLQVRTQEPVQPRRLRPDLPRDLETVCLKAIEKEPARRYATAAALAEDLGRFLAGKPVAARPIGPPARLIRWARRSPVVASLAAMLLVLSVGSLATMLVLWQRAEEKAAEARSNAAMAELRRDHAREGMRLYATSAHRVFRDPNLTDAERVALDRAVNLTLEMLDEAGGDPEVEQRTAYAVLQLADALHLTGDVERAGQLCRRASEVFARLSAADPDKPRLRKCLAESRLQLSSYYRATGQNDQALQCVREAVQLDEGLVAQFPRSDEYRSDLACHRSLLATTLAVCGDRSEAGELFEKSVAVQRDLIDRYSNDADRYRYLGATYQAYRQYALAAAPERFRELVFDQVNRCEQALAKRTDRPILARNLSLKLSPSILTELDRLGHRSDSDDVARRWAEVLKTLADRFPEDPEALADYAQWLYAIGFRQWPTDPNAAGQSFRQAKAIAARTLSLPQGCHHIEPLYAEMLADCPDPAVVEPQRAAALARSLRGAEQKRILGMALYQSGDYPAARRELEAHRQEVRAKDSDVAHAHALAYLAMARWQTGDREAARKLFEQIQAAMRATPDAGSRAAVAVNRASRLIESRDDRRTTALAPDSH